MLETGRHRRCSVPKPIDLRQLTLIEAKGLHSIRAKLLTLERAVATPAVEMIWPGSLIMADFVVKIADESGPDRMSGISRPAAG